MRIVSTRTIDGPNVFTYSPVVVMTIDLQDLYERESCDLPGFVDGLLERVPTLAEHVCGKGYPGGFVERLRAGTYLGHVVEHVAIAWGTALGATGNYGKTVRSARPDCFDIVVSSLVHQATRHCCMAPWPSSRRLSGTRPSTQRPSSRPHAGSLTTRRSARAPARSWTRPCASGIPWKRLDDESLVQLGYGKHRRLVRSTVSDATSAIAVEIAQDKAATKALLARAFIPVPARTGGRDRSRGACGVR